MIFATPHPITVYRHGADLSLFYPLMWNVILEYIATHFSVLGKTRTGNHSEILPDLPHTPANAQLCDAVMVVASRNISRKYRTHRVLNPGPVVCKSITTRSPTAAFLPSVLSATVACIVGRVDLKGLVHRGVSMIKNFSEIVMKKVSHKML